MNALLFCCAAAWLGADPAAAPVAFEFQDAAAHDGRSMIHYRAIEFRESPVQPLAGDFSPTAGALYGQLPVGPAPETALGVVWLPEVEGGPILWLDANGDGRLTTDERRVVNEKEIEIPATITVAQEPELKRVQRTLSFRRPFLGTGLRYAVRGYAAGHLALGPDEHRVLLADGNADGCLDTVGQDRVWIDLDGDGRFDGLTEQFPLGKPLVKDKEVYVIRSDPLAAAVRANLRKPGEGKLRLTLAGAHAVSKFSAELVSDLGELVAADKLNEPIPVPYGEYRVSSLKSQLTDSDGQKWNYSFSRRAERYFSVPIGQETTAPVLDQLAMQVTLDLEKGRAAPSQTLTVRPQVVADGEMLYLSSCTIGEEDRFRSAEASAEILLLSPEGKVVNRGLSGFS